MDPLSILIGVLVFLALLFLGVIALLWGLKQILTIQNQNDIIISFLEQASMALWNESHIQTELHEEMRDAELSGMRVRAA